MTTKLEKTAAFLKKIAAEGFMDRLGGMANTSLWGPTQGQQVPFEQPAPRLPVSAEDPVAAVNNPGTGQSRGTSIPQSELDRINANTVPGGNLVDKMGEKPGFMSNLGAAFQRGHAGTIAATGATALLAGLLTYNLLKRKSSKGNVIQMRGQRKAASWYNPASWLAKAKVDPQGNQIPAGFLRRGAGWAKDKTVKGKNWVKENPKKSIAGGAVLVAGGATPLMLGGGDQTWADKNLGISTGSDIGDAAVGTGVAALGGLGLYALYKKLRDDDEAA